MTALVLGVLGASLVGSVHCAGMCGPLVAVYAGMAEAPAGPRRRAALHAAYSAGRLAGYATLGAAAGAVGAAVDLAAAPRGVRGAAGVLAGALIAIAGIHALLKTRGVGAGRAAPPFLRRLIGRMLGTVARRPPVVRAALLGAATALLPCGWLYAFAVTAAGTGSAAGGTIVMAVFWAGTLPVMVAFGEAIRLLAEPLRRHVPAVCAVVLIVLGLATVVSRLGPALVGDGTAACHGTR